MVFALDDCTAHPARERPNRSDFSQLLWHRGAATRIAGRNPTGRTPRWGKSINLGVAASTKPATTPAAAGAAFRVHQIDREVRKRAYRVDGQTPSVRASSHRVPRTTRIIRSSQQKTSAPHGADVSGSGGGIRTPDLWVMSPTSCRCSTPRHACGFDFLAAPHRGWGVSAAASPAPPRVAP